MNDDKVKFESYQIIKNYRKNYRNQHIETQF